jgi:hypothetical protein
MCIVEYSTATSTFIILLQNSMYQNLNSICDIFIFKTLNSWFVCVYLQFLLPRESFDAILYDTHHSTMGVLHLVPEPCRI